jgi:peptidoglycan biosynthesis protein MviN/MurJ (putative lipid II flippase)
MALGSVFLLLGKIVGAAKEMAIAWRYGVSEIVDAYLFLFNLVTWPVSVWFGVLTIVLVPLAVTIRERNPVELPRFRSELLGVTLILGSLLWLLAEFGFRLFLHTALGPLPGPALSQALEMAPTLSWIALFGMPISLFSAWTMAAHNYTNTLLEGIPALVILLVVLMNPSNVAAPLMWGTVAGFALHLVSLSACAMRRGELERPHLALQSPYWGAFSRGFGIMLAGQVVSNVSNVVDQLFAAHLGAGSIATLSYANRIVALIVGLGATAVGRATLPVFSQAHAKGLRHVSRMAMYWVLLLFGLGVMALTMGWWLAPWGVRTLFERGAFSAHDTRMVAEVLRYALFQVPFFFSSLVLVSVLSSRRDYSTLLFAGLVGLAVKLVGNVVLVPWISIKGLALSNALFYGFSGAFLLAMVKRRKQDHSMGK